MDKFTKSNLHLDDTHNEAHYPIFQVIHELYES
jgi:hypothetical protein